MKRFSFSLSRLVRWSVLAAAVVLVAGPASAEQVLRIVKYTIAQPDQQQQLFQLTDQINELYAKSKGFRWLKLSYDEATGEYMAVSLWKSRAVMEAAVKDDAFQTLLGKLKPLTKGDFSAKTYKVYEPKK
jgi:quinol monooxygenase YgiN